MKNSEIYYVLGKLFVFLKLFKGLFFLTTRRMDYIFLKFTGVYYSVRIGCFLPEPERVADHSA